MRILPLLLPALWYQIESAIAAPSLTQSQQPLTLQQQNNVKELKGRFLHITDLHPDPFYETYSSTSSDNACHSGSGPAGYYGAEVTDCDSPLTLINATFDWIAHNLASNIDFIVWTGDSARHDNDESIPRNESQVLATNRLLVNHFRQVFGNNETNDENDDTFTLPIVPTFGNNDILPHNIFLEGPNRWTRAYSSIWQPFIPEEQRHGFERFGSFYQEVIPDQLAVFSLNTMYFFAKNAGVDGCADPDEPGAEVFDWLRVRLELLRQRGMKALLSGHVPPARTSSKQQWDETCWQKYALWLRQYRDVIVAGLWGHMNVEHFMLQDFKEIDWDVLDVERSDERIRSSRMDDDVSIASTEDYLKDLRHQWAKLPTPPSSMLREEYAREALSSVSDEARPQWEIDEFAKRGHIVAEMSKDKEDKKREHFLKEVGGRWHERYGVSLVSASVVPNFFPTLRVFEYNTTGLDSRNAFDKDGKTWLARAEAKLQREEWDLEDVDEDEGPEYTDDGNWSASRKHKDKKGNKNKKPSFTIPDAPSKSANPGPAYSPQSLTLLGYTQYFANLTEINNDFHSAAECDEHDDIEPSWLGDVFMWKKGKHHDKKPNKSSPQPKEFAFQVEYDTRHDKLFKLRDLTVGEWVRLARRIGRKGEPKADVAPWDGGDDDDDEGWDGDGMEEEDVEAQKKHKHKKDKKKKKKKKKHARNKVWYAFIRRAFVSTMTPDEIDDTYG